jgi:hypothetical protein
LALNTVGITLSPGPIRQAPAEIRRWIEQQGAGGFLRTGAETDPP